MNAILSIGEEVLCIPWQGEFATLGPKGSFRFLVRDILEAWGEADAGPHLVDAFSVSDSPLVLAEIYIDRGRELAIFPDGRPSAPVISREHFKQLGRHLLPKIIAAVEDNSIQNAPFYWDIARSWMHLGDADDARAWLARGIEGSGQFAAKVAKGMVIQSTSSEGIRYEYQSNPDEDMYDEGLLFDAAKRHLDSDPSLSSDEQSLLRAVVSGLERERKNDTKGDTEVLGPAAKRKPRRRAS